jgi:hypothetical protein
MPEEISGPFRSDSQAEQQGNFPSEPQFSTLRRTGLVVKTYRTSRSVQDIRTRNPRVEYAEFKALMESSFERLQSEIREQHEETRSEVRLTRFEILATIRSSPSESVQVICELGLAVCAFCLLLRYLFSIEIVNTGFAFFGMFSLGVYWLMAYVKARQDRSRSSSVEER